MLDRELYSVALRKINKTHVELYDVNLIPSAVAPLLAILVSKCVRVWLSSTYGVRIK